MRMLRDWLIALFVISVGTVAACVTDKPEPQTPADTTTSTTHTTSSDGFYGPGYGGTTSYGQTNGPQGEPTRGAIYARPDGGTGYTEQGPGDIRTDPVAR